MYYGFRADRGLLIGTVTVNPRCRALAMALLALTPQLALGSSPGSAQTQRADPLDAYTIRSWNETDGLASGAVWSISQDAEGFLWLGTDAGLIRFDGVRFVAWRDRLPALPQSRVRALCNARDGSFWVGFDSLGGITRIRGRQVTQFRSPDGFDDTGVTGIVEDSAGTIWAGTRYGLYRFRGQQWEKLRAREHLPETWVFGLRVNRNGELWVANEAGVYRRNAERDVFQLVERSDRTMQGFGVEIVDGVTWITDPQIAFKRAGEPRGSRRASGIGNGVQLLHDRRGTLWIATIGQGLWRARVAGTTVPVVEAMTARNSPLTDDIRSLFEDRDGNLWVGSSVGLHQFSPKIVMSFTDVGVVRAVEATPEGSVWLATADGLLQIAGLRKRRYDEGDGLPSGSVTALHVDRRGRLFVATADGLALFRDGRFVPIPSDKIPRPLNINGMSADSHGNLWVSNSPQGVFVWNGREITPFDAFAEVDGRDIYVVHADRDNRLWFTLTGGRIGTIEQNGKLQIRRSPTHLQRTLGPPIYEDSHGAIWILEDNALHRLAAETIVTATSINALPRLLSAMVEDEAGDFWIGAGTGVLRVSRAEFEQLARNPSHQLRFSLYDRSDGLTAMPTRRGRPAAVRARDGRLWFVTGNGVAVIDRTIAANAPPPPVHIDAIIVDDQRVNPISGAHLPGGTARIEIDYTAVSFTSPTKVRFRYRLDGFDRDWYDAGTSRQAIYTHLPPGRHRFQVVSVNHEGTWSRPAAWDFMVTPRFYETTSFYLVGTATIVLIGLALWRLRLYQIRREFALVLGERVRLSREIHDTLLQGLIGVALQFEALSSTLESSPSSAKQHLVRLRRRVEAYIREARQSIWNLRSPILERHDLTEALRDACQLATEGTSVELTFTFTGAPRRCPPKIEEQLLRIAQEAVTNAVRHAQPTRIHLQLHYDPGAVHLCVSDDGRGFDPVGSSETRGGYGLQSMRERAGQVGGCCRIVTSPGKGTRVEVTIPDTAVSGDGQCPPRPRAVFGSSASKTI
jgi:signal transduction histidine kinase/ligand-binding sensor domain-containing protein